jgi:two-component system NtrC family sensor kinase
MLNLFANINLTYLLYLVYGAAFLFLGVSITAKDMKGSDLKLADNLWLLGTFGFLHGAREWLELGHLIESRQLSAQQIYVEKALEVSLTIFSFLFLLQFGISLISKLDEKRFRWVKAIPGPLVIIWALHCWHYGIHEGIVNYDVESLQNVDIAARFAFGFTGGGLTACGLIAYSREVMMLSRSVAKKLLYAGITFAFYAVFAGILSSKYFKQLLPVPIELFRGASAFFITYFITKALNLFDIETRHKIEQQTRRLIQVEKLTSLGQLAAGIAHEINNPLTNASLGIQTLKNKIRTNSAGPDAYEKLDAIERNIDRASAIAQELLQFSRQQECEFSPVDINSVLQSALTLLQYKLKPVTVVQSLGEVPDVMGDQGKLEQVFINVLSNSIEAMAPSETIFLSTAVQGDMVIVRIIDAGSGIEQENLSKLFDPFFTTKEIGSGTGLGLSICYGIIRQHQGIIEITSEAGKGTEVTIRLPVRERYEKDIDR